MNKDNILLRGLTIDDLSFLLEIRNHKTTRTYLENDTCFTYEQCIGWFKNLQSEWFIVEVDNKKIGYVRTDGDYVGVDIHMEYRKMGYATQVFLKYLENKSYAKLWVFDDNFAKKMYLKLGFTPTKNKKIIREREYIEMEYKRLKVCKVIVTALIDRKRMGGNYPHHAQNHTIPSIIKMLKDSIKLDKLYKPGVEMDTIIVNNIIDINNKKNDLIRKLSDTNIKIIERPNNGGSFGAYLDIFQKYKTKYDYFIFTEDDIIVGGTENYVQQLIEDFHNNNASFISLIGIENTNYPIHAHGGIGLTSTKILEQVFNNENPYSYEGFDRNKSIQHEIDFTNKICNITKQKLIFLGIPKWDLNKNYCISYPLYNKNI